ncbi:hypothetical protein F5X99DRAFT_403638 [Biscogniauxia marginata]|nr:hypothetical protein F5X99DRAFT_403638 [Biscogniauxia marginata]
MPNFTDLAAFPAFYELPPALPSASSPSSGYSDGGDLTWFLLAQIKENMTLTKPTLIVTDRKGVDFAVTFEDDPGVVDLKGRGFRKGHTLVAARATRTDREEGKKAIVRIERGCGGDVKVIPGSLERVFELGLVLDGDDVGRKCAACGNDAGSLSRCTGCGTAAYCSKSCQVKGWGDMGHKSNCKVLRSIKDIWG